MANRNRTTNYTNATDRAARERREREANACDHGDRYSLDCTGRDAQGSYTLEGCAGCDTRFKVRDDGSADAFLFHPPSQAAYVPNAAEYTPQYDGIDAFNSWIEETREGFAVNLFDARGGRGGVGDYTDNIVEGVIIDDDNSLDLDGIE